MAGEKKIGGVCSWVWIGEMAFLFLEEGNAMGGWFFFSRVEKEKDKTSNQQPKIHRIILFTSRHVTTVANFTIPPNLKIKLKLQKDSVNCRK